MTTARLKQTASHKIFDSTSFIQKKKKKTEREKKENLSTELLAREHETKNRIWNEKNVCNSNECVLNETRKKREKN